MSRKHVRAIAAAVAPLGLEVVPAKGHFQIREDGRFVATFAGSPKDKDTCIRRAVRDAKRYRLGLA